MSSRLSCPLVVLTALMALAMPVPAHAPVVGQIQGTVAMAGRDSAGTARLLELVNAWRAIRNMAPIPASQLEASDYNRVDVRASRSFAVGGQRSVELSAQVLNLLGRDNLIGGTGGAFQNSAVSNAFGTYSGAGARQEAELGIRFEF